MRPHVPMQREEKIFLLQYICTADRCSFISVARIRPANDLSLLVETKNRIFEFPGQPHVVVKLEKIFASQTGIEMRNCRMLREGFMDSRFRFYVRCHINMRRAQVAFSRRLTPAAASHFRVSDRMEQENPSRLR